MAQQSSLVERAYQYLLREIVSLRLKPGETVYETTISNVLQLSRTPVREAIVSLKHEGLLTQDSARRTVVTPITVKNVREPFQVREAVEGMAARLAAQVATADDIAEIIELNELATQSLVDNNPRGYFMNNWRFHERLVQTSGNQLLLKTFGEVRSHLFRVDHLSFFASYFPGEMIEKDNPEHQEVISAVRMGDPDRAESVIRQHIASARVRLLDMIHHLNFGDIASLEWVYEDSPHPDRAGKKAEKTADVLE